MDRKAIPLFAGSFIILSIGLGLFPLLPLYAAEFGATPTAIGLFLALVYLANAAGYALPGWLPAGRPRRWVLALVYWSGVPALALLGHATAFWQVIGLTSLLWFSGGAALAHISVVIGLTAGKQSRGRSFGLNNMAYPLGALAGGATFGPLIATQGYGFLFTALAAVWVAVPVIGSSLPVPGAAARPSPRATPGQAAPRPSGSFATLLSLALLSATAIGASRLGMVLLMQALDYSPSQVSFTNLVSGLATVPAVLLMGAASDRVGRERVLALVYGLATAGAAGLAAASQPWHFWLAATALLVAFSANQALTRALAADRLRPEELARRLPRLLAVSSIAGIISYAATGFVVDHLGRNAIFFVSAGLAVAAAAQLARLSAAGRGGQRAHAGTPHFPEPAPAVARGSVEGS